MSYDPRAGQSPYLGMDSEDDIQLGLMDEPAAEGGFGSGRQAFSAGETTVAPPTSPAQAVPATVRRASRAAGRNTTTHVARTDAEARTLLREQSQQPRAVPGPQQQRFDPQPDPSLDEGGTYGEGPSNLVGRVALVLLSWLLRAAAIALALLVVLSAVLSGSLRARLVGTLNLAPLFVPPALLGRFVLETPFGGVLRGDIALVSVILFFLDWLCLRKASTMRKRAEGRA